MIITTMRKGRLSIEPGARTVWLRDDEYRRLLNEQRREACEALTPPGLVCMEVEGELRVVTSSKAAALAAVHAMASVNVPARQVGILREAFGWALRSYRPAVRAASAAFEQALGDLEPRL